MIVRGDRITTPDGSGVVLYVDAPQYGVISYLVQYDEGWQGVFTPALEEA